MKTPTDSDKVREKRRNKEAAPDAPEVVKVSVTPHHPAPQAKPGPDEVWVTLLDSSPWSSKGVPTGERTPPAALRSPLAPVAESPTLWNEPVWRTPARTEEPQVAAGDVEPTSADSAEIAGPGEPMGIDPREALTSLADLVRRNETLHGHLNLQEPPRDDVAAAPEVAEPIGASAPEVEEPAVPVIEPVMDTADVPAAVPEIDVRIQVETIEMAAAIDEPAPIEDPVVAEEPEPVVEEAPMAVAAEPEEPEEPVAVEAARPEASDPEEPVIYEPEVYTPEPEVAVAPSAPEPQQLAEKPKSAARSPKKAAVGVVQEVPVEDLLGGVISLAGSALRGAASATAGVVGGLVKGAGTMGSGLVAGAKRLSGSAGDCRSCGDSGCGSDAKSK